MVTIRAEPMQMKILLQTYQGAIEPIRRELKSKIEFYSNFKHQEALEKYGWENGEKKEWLECIKDFIVLQQEDWINPVTKIKKEVKKLSKEDYEYNVKQEYYDLVKEKDWASASELLRDYVLSQLNIFTIKNDNQSEMWVYQDGIYIPQGRSAIKELLRKLLKKWYSQWIFGKVIEKIEPDTYIEPENFFKIINRNEIPVLNGILNVETLELLPFSKDKIFFSKMPVKFNLSSQCPKIDKFLSEVLRDEEDKKIFYELAGFGLYRSYFLEKAVIMAGEGRNGKGKSIELLKRLVGIQNCCSIPLTSLRCDSFSISELFGKMFNLAGDIGNQDLKDTSMFKSLTGRDLVNGKRKFQNDVVFENHAKFVFACNELPMVYDMSKGFWDRWVLFEYPYTFVDEQEYQSANDKTNLRIRNPNVINEITTEEEMSGFLNQALLGLQRIKEQKAFSSTKGSEQIKSTWIRKSNSFIAFCYDNLEDDSEGAISKKELRKKYSAYCKEHKVCPKSEIVIKRVLQDTFGVVDDRINVIQGVYEWFWRGIKWKS